MLKSKVAKKIGTGLLICTLALGIGVAQRPTEAKACTGYILWTMDSYGGKLLSTAMSQEFSYDVQTVQLNLNQSGILAYNCGANDGFFGTRTKAGVIAWQKAHGLVADGIVGLSTWNSIQYHVQ